MAKTLTFNFSQKRDDEHELLICFAAGENQLGEDATKIVPEGLFEKSSRTTGFKGKSLSVLDLIAPEKVKADRLLIVGLGEISEMEEPDWLTLGGKLGSLITGSNLEKTSILLDVKEIGASQAALIASGMKLNAYRFDTYKTKKDEDDKENADKAITVTLVLKQADEAEKCWKKEEGVIEGALLARTLVNEPANILGPVEFASKASDLAKLGVEVEILTEKEMSDLRMGALLGVAQGSVRPPRLAVMKWMGGKKDDKPIAFIGKGVVFDTGGISLKPAGGMEDMKGDMGGAAAVIGLMHALASRKAKANVICVLGLVENMPDGNAQRPGDIVTSMSGQTIEVINTDAEGRLVLCDALTYVNDKYEPRFMINLATLTGAVLIALGHHHAGLFSNDDDLSLQIAASGQATGEQVWRLPLSKDYDKLIESKFADMKNVGGRSAGSITAAQFLKRFVGETPWAHLDIAGVAMASPQTQTNQSWGSGFGVRLLDRLVRDHYE